MRLAPLLALLLLTGCPEPEPEPVDDDDATLDDDDDGWPPMEGDWAGPAEGVVILPGGATQPCEGAGEATVDEADRATGTADCTFAATGETCTIDFADFDVGGGNRPVDDFSCWATGEATLSNWYDGTRLHGRVQLFSAGYQVELRWDLDRVE